MTYSNLFKQLKRRLRMRKRWLTLGIYLLLAGAVAAAFWANRTPAEEEPADLATLSDIAYDELSDEASAEAVTAAALETIRSGSGKREVILRKQYICGDEETMRMGTMTGDSIISLHEKQHPEAKVTLDESGRVHILEHVEDLSPNCRENAYFGLDKNGNLSLFDGIPEQDRVIRTFFQLDVQHMKSSLPGDALDQLYTGIRVSDLEDYNSVLSTFSEYAAKPAANPKP